MGGGGEQMRKRRPIREIQAERRTATPTPRAPTRMRWWQKLEHTIAIVAGIAAIAGFGTWVWEFPDREEERQVRRSQLISDARAVLRASLETGVVDSDMDPSVGFAIEVLTKYSQPIELNATTVNLGHLTLGCAEIAIKANSISLGFSKLGRSSLYLSAPTIEMTDVTMTDTSMRIDFPILVNEVGGSDAPPGEATGEEAPPTKPYFQAQLNNVNAEGGYWFLPGTRSWFDSRIGLSAREKGATIVYDGEYFGISWMNMLNGNLELPGAVCSAQRTFDPRVCENIGYEPTFDPPLWRSDCRGPSERFYATWKPMQMTTKFPVPKQED